MCSFATNVRNFPWSSLNYDVKRPSEPSEEIPLACRKLTSLCTSQAFALLGVIVDMREECLWPTWVTVISAQWKITQKTGVMKPLISSAQHCWYSQTYFCVLKRVTPTLSDSQLNTQKFLLGRMTYAFFKALF